MDDPDPRVVRFNAARRFATGRARASRTDHELTVIVPAHNEEQRLPATLRALCDFLDGSGLDYRVLVVDDGSQDGTAACAEGLGPRVAVMRQPVQRGKGAAVRAGMLRATGAVLAFTDADLPFDLAALLEGYERIRDCRCDVVYGARDAEGAACCVRRRFLRTAASAVFRRVVQVLVSREVTDTQCGLKLFRREAAIEIFSRTTIEGFAFDAEVVFLAHRLGLSYQRVPVTLINEYSSTLSLSRHALPMLWDVLRIRARDWHASYRLPAVPLAERVLRPVDEVAERRLAAA